MAHACPHARTHPLTGLPLQPAGFVNGRPVWPILGASDDGADGDDAGTGEDKTAGDEDKPLGPAGEKALAAEKDRRKAEADKRRAAEQRASDLEAELARLRAGSDGEDRPDADAIRAEAEKNAAARAAARILKSEIRAAAAGKLADPADAHRFLDLSRFDVTDGGDIDEAEIADAIEELIKTKPYLAAQGGTQQRGSADAGARKGSRPSQLTREQLKSMSPEQIEQARTDGCLNDLLGIR